MTTFNLQSGKRLEFCRMLFKSGLVTYYLIPEVRYIGIGGNPKQKSQFNCLDDKNEKSIITLF